MLDTTEIRNKIDLLVKNVLEEHDTTGEFTEPTSDGRTIDTKKWTTWDWQQGVGIYGLWTLYKRTGDSKYKDLLVQWFEENIDHPPAKNINTMCPLLTLAFLYEETRNEKYLPVIKDWTNFVMNDLPRTQFGCFQHTTSLHLNEEQIWDDTLFMTVLALAKIGKIFNKQEYIDEAKKQFLLIFQFLYDRKTGLFYHGWTFKEMTHFGAVKWGRGNAWITVAIPELYNILEIDPTANPYDPVVHILNSMFVAQVDALEKYQDKATGLYYTVIDAPEDKDNYFESSATAGFSCGIYKGIKLGLLDEKKYKPLADRGTQAVLNKISSDGALQDTSFGTRVGDNKEAYYGVKVTAMPYGQSLAIMNLVEVI